MFEKLKEKLENDLNSQKKQWTKSLKEITDKISTPQSQIQQIQPVTEDKNDFTKLHMEFEARLNVFQENIEQKFTSIHTRQSSVESKLSNIAAPASAPVKISRATSPSSVSKLTQTILALQQEFKLLSAHKTSAIDNLTTLMNDYK